ncbi:MAG: hypothetical protein AAF628_00100 [Planctomycetota bacterium]
MLAPRAQPKRDAPEDNDGNGHHEAFESVMNDLVAQVRVAVVRNGRSERRERCGEGRSGERHEDSGFKVGEK